MKKQGNDYILTEEEINEYRDFISSTLYSEWDSYTSNYICRGVSSEEGKRRMNPEMYEIMETIDSLKYK